MLVVNENKDLLLDISWTYQIYGQLISNSIYLLLPSMFSRTIYNSLYWHCV